MSETKAIERTTTDAFIVLYNSMHDTDYVPKEYADAPDVRCVDSQGNTLNLEITQTEDRLGDIKALLGRSKDRDMEALKIHLEKVKAGLADPLKRVSCLSADVSGVLIKRICAKMNKRYGPNTALVVRDTSGVDWDWNLVTNDIRQKLQVIQNPFDKGIWIIPAAQNRLFSVT